jgi:putative DNA primase/helicase
MKEKPEDNVVPLGRVEEHAPQDSWKLVAVRMSDVEAKRIVWLWRNRIARGKLTIFAGLPDVNKSTTALDLTARVTVGGLLPAGEGQAPLGSVIILSAEDDAADTIRPRLEVMGANLERVHNITMGKEERGKGKRSFDMTQDIERLERLIQEIGEVVLVVIDPLSAYLGKPGKLDSYRNTDVRAVLSPLGAMAARCGVAVIGIDHLNKTPGVKALLRLAGSIAFAAAPRAIYVFVRDEEDEDRRLFLPAKNNISKIRTGLALRIVERLAPPPIFDAFPAVEWEDEPVTQTADEALAAEARDGRRSETAEMAKRFLQEMLRSGPRMAADIQAEAERRKLGLKLESKSMRNAKKALGVQSVKKGKDGWEWYLPSHAQDDLPMGKEPL